MSPLIGATARLLDLPPGAVEWALATAALVAPVAWVVIIDALLRGRRR